jgi:hypothetical protein
VFQLDLPAAGDDLVGFSRSLNGRPGKTLGCAKASRNSLSFLRSPIELAKGVKPNLQPNGV